MLSIKHAINIADLRELARHRLPRPVFNYLDGGAEDELTMRRNTANFDNYEFMPRVLTDISAIDLSTSLLGIDLALPFFLSPTGMSRLFHKDREFAVCRAAAKAGTLYSLSTLGTTSIEDIAKTSRTPKMFQMYIFKDRDLVREFVTRCEAAKFDAICLTVDTPIAGNRERDRRTGMTMPPRLTLASWLHFALRPGWSLAALKAGEFEMANVAHRVDALADAAMSVPAYIDSQFDRRINWDDAAWLRAQWSKPLLVKGITSVADATIAASVGFDGIMISNHGGRQLDGAPACVDQIGPIADAVGDQVQIVCDGGIRRGSHVVKALALGATACSMGKSYLFGLAAGGEAGVAKAIEIIEREIRTCLTLLGVNEVTSLNAEYIRRRLG